MYKNKLDAIRKEYLELQEKVIDTKNMSNRREYKKLTTKFNSLEKIISCHDEILELETVINQSQEFIDTEDDAEIVELAVSEKEEALESLSEKQNLLKKLLVPKDPNDQRDCIIEIRAGTGGDEAGLFVGDLYRMYSYFSETKGWKKSIISSNQSGKGGFKEIIFALSGQEVYGTMRFESGVHRVQRVPETEGSGRIHTSAVTVAVFPEADEVDVVIENKDLKIDVYRSSGNGGQSVNTTDSAVRITHLPTGVVVTCQDEKSQLKNRNKAMKVLRSRLYDAQVAKKESEIASNRKSQVGTGDRSGKIRTYNYPQGRVTDHRINLTLYKLDSILSGDIAKIVQGLKIAFYEEQRKE